MKYISIFSGIEAASVAWQPLGWKPLAFSEIEPFPKAVLAARYPDVPDLGDITKIDWSNYANTADVVVGGSPCQSFSIAGKREGLAGASGLMYEYIRAVQDIRPQWCIWENVPGAFTSEHGDAFRQLLASLDDLGYGLAWRVLDAQFFGVPQRRRRIFLIGSLGDQRAAEVLFERESLCVDLASSREKRQELARGAKSGTGSASYEIAGNIIGRKIENGGNGNGFCDANAEAAYTLTATDVHAVLESNSKQYDSVQSCLTPWDTQSRRIYSADGVMSTLDARTGKSGTDSKSVLCARDYGSSTTIGYDIAQTSTAHEGISASYILRKFSKLRRLTPLESERLQGFPDGWTDITYRGKTAPDSARYKALGNSMDMPVMRWIGERISE